MGSKGEPAPVQLQLWQLCGMLPAVAEAGLIVFSDPQAVLDELRLRIMAAMQTIEALRRENVMLRKALEDDSA